MFRRFMADSKEWRFERRWRDAYDRVNATVADIELYAERGERVPRLDRVAVRAAPAIVGYDAAVRSLELQMRKLEIDSDEHRELFEERRRLLVEASRYWGAVRDGDEAATPLLDDNAKGRRRRREAARDLRRALGQAGQGGL